MGLKTNTFCPISPFCSTRFLHKTNIHLLKNREKERLIEVKNEKFINLS